MRCPACGRERASGTRCGACGRTFPPNLIEQYDRLVFLLDEARGWAAGGLVGEAQRAAITERYQTRVQELEILLRQEAVPPARLPAAPAPAASPARPGVLRVDARPATAGARLNWETLWRALLSERLPETLLYVGAVLILAAAATLVYFNWGRFSPVLQLAFLAAGTASLLLLGWLLWTRWRLPQSGLVLMALGALTIPVDFYAWIRFRAVPPDAYPAWWLIVSAVCALVYAGMTWRLRAPVFLIITQAASYSLVAALLKAAAIPTGQWAVAAVAAATYLVGTGLFGRWSEGFAASGLVVAAHAAGTLAIGGVLLVARVPLASWPIAFAAAALLGAAAPHVVRAGAALARSSYLGGAASLWLGVIVAVAARSPSDVQVVLTGVALAAAIGAAVLVHRHRDPILEALTRALAPSGAPVLHWAAAALALLELALGWIWWRPIPHGLPAAGLIAATTLVLLGRRLARLDPSYARPWLATGAAWSVAMLALVVLMRDRTEIAMTLVLAGAGYAVWARVLNDARLANPAIWATVAAVASVLPDAVRAGWLPSATAYAWVFAGAGAALLLLGSALDRRVPHLSGAAHAASHVLVPVAIMWSAQDAHVARWTLGAAILFYAASAALAHTGQHPSFAALAHRVARAVRVPASTAGAVFVYAVAWLVPLWFHLAVPLVPWIGQNSARVGAATAALAWPYLVLAWPAGRLATSYALPWRIAAQALAIVGGLQAGADRTWLLAVVASGALQQVALYWQTRSVAWVYTAGLTWAGLLGLVLTTLALPVARAGWALLALGAAYVALAEVPLRRAPGTITATTFALYAVSFVVVAVGLLLAALPVSRDAAIAYAGGAVIFIWAGRRLADPLFGFPVAGLLAASYVSAIATLLAPRGIPETQLGLWLAPAIAAYLAAGRLLDRRAPSGLRLGVSWAGPMYAAAHIGIVAMVAISVGDAILLSAALGIAAAGYGLFAWLVRSPVWLYPALLAGHAALFFGALRAGLDPRAVPAVYTPVVAMLVAIGRWRERASGGRPLSDVPWAQPWVAVALADIGLWGLAGVIAPGPHAAASLIFAGVLGLLAVWWRGRWLAAAALVLLALAGAEGLRWRAVSWPSALLIAALVALGSAVSAVFLHRAGRGALWQPGLRGLALGLSTATVLVAGAGVAWAWHPRAGDGLVYALAVVGLLHLLLAVADRRAWLGYLGVALVLGAWGLFLFQGLRSREIQWYALPAAVYLLGVAVAERRLGRRTLARVIDVAGLLLLFGSAFWQSLGVRGFRYAVLLAAEGLLVAWAGAALRLRVHFLAGLGVVLVDLIVQMIDPLRALNTTILFLGFGVLLVAVAVVAERKRVEIARTTQRWRTRMEAWR
jgi:hypothetical protein